VRPCQTRSSCLRQRFWPANIAGAIDNGFLGGCTFAEASLVHPFAARAFAFGQFRLIANPIERLSSIATALTN
jgi:hypothetical protein